MKLATAQIGYVGRPNELVLDTTAKSGAGVGKLLAPRWDIINGYAHGFGKLSWEDYTNLYTNILRNRYKKDPTAFNELTHEARVVVVKCYCGAWRSPHCHRYILVDILGKIARHNGMSFEYLGEFNYGH